MKEETIQNEEKISAKDKESSMLNVGGIENHSKNNEAPNSLSNNDENSMKNTVENSLNNSIQNSINNNVENDERNSANSNGNNGEIQPITTKIMKTMR